LTTNRNLHYKALQTQKEEGVIPKHKEEATDDIREKGERG
jgi:hypothetical protein